MRTRGLALLMLLAAVSGATLLESQSAVPTNLGIKYVRDSEEYATLARQVYRGATGAVISSAAGGAFWGVILDIDETALDNSSYQLERGAYGLPYDDASWNAWVNRRVATAVPGVVDFV